MSETIEVLFTCHKCKKAKVSITVPIRTPGTDLGLWMDIVAQTVADKHMEISPHCREGKVDLWIPVEGRNSVGGPIIN